MIHAIRDRVIIKPDEQADDYKNGIIIPKESKEESSTGKVIDVGPGTSVEKTVINKGDHVLFNPQACETIIHNGYIYNIVIESHVYAIYDDSEFGLKPLHERVFVAPEKEKAEERGIFIPPSHRRRSFFGKVKAVGDEVYNYMNLEAGDDILFEKHTGFELPDFEERIFSIIVFDIQAKILDKSKISVV